MRRGQLLLALLVGGCSHERMHAGHLADVKPLTLTLYDLRQSDSTQPAEWRLAISNVDAKGRCLELGDDLAVEVNGAREDVFERGQMESVGKVVFSDKSCGSATAVANPTVLAPEDVVVVRDRTLTARAVFPHVLERIHFAASPAVPATASPGDRVVFRIEPPPAAPLDVSFGLESAHLVTIPFTRVGPSFETTLPATSGTGKGSLVVMERGSVPARTCTGATSCTAQIEQVILATIAIVAKSP